MSNETDYRNDAKEDAKSTVLEYLEDIVDSLIDNGEASDDLFNDYPNGDSYHHENHVDRYYSLLEAAECLDQLSRWEETDSGLWQGLEPREAIGAQAAYTYGNAVCDYWRDLINEINGDIADILDPFEEEEAACEEEEKDLPDDFEERKRAAVEKYVRETVANF